MKIEVLFPEICNLFGDLFNMNYLKLCIPEAEYINTSLTDEPAFVTDNVQMIYLGPMTERMQETLIEKLMPHRERLVELIESGTVFLLTGNACEIFGRYIQNEDGSKIEGLDILKMYAKRDMMNRHNSKFLGKFEDATITGFKVQFTMNYPDSEEHGFVLKEKGIGMNEASEYEGYRYKNLFVTYLVGPILVMNPEFTKKVLALLGIQDRELAFEAAVSEAHKKRVLEFYE